MPRDREHVRAARRRARTDAQEAEIAAIFAQGRAWFFRAILGLIAAGLLLLLSWLLASVMALVAVGCVVQGVRVAIPATRMQEALKAADD